jgi:hypothetical protein
MAQVYPTAEIQQSKVEQRFSAFVGSPSSPLQIGSLCWYRIKANSVLAYQQHRHWVSSKIRLPHYIDL